MKLQDIIKYLRNKDKLNDLYDNFDLNRDSEVILIYFKNGLYIENDIELLDYETTNDDIEINLNGVRYIQFMPIDLASDLVLNDFANIKDDFELAERLFQYRINDA